MVVFGKNDKEILEIEGYLFRFSLFMSLVSY